VGVVELFRRQWDQIADTARPELMRLAMPERSARLAEMLTSLGYMAESTGGALPVITEHNCAIRLIAERFPEVCAAEERFIADLLGAPVTRQPTSRRVQAAASTALHGIGNRMGIVGAPSEL
jgi:predicted ArsR family transcriptional regulator